MATSGSFSGESSDTVQQEVVCFFRDAPISASQSFYAVTEFDDDGVPTGTVTYYNIQTGVVFVPSGTELLTLTAGECEPDVYSQRALIGGPGAAIGAAPDGASVSTLAPPWPVPVGARLVSITVVAYAGSANTLSPNRVDVAVGPNPARPLAAGETVDFVAIGDDGRLTETFIISCTGNARASVNLQYINPTN